MYEYVVKAPFLYKAVAVRPKTAVVLIEVKQEPQNSKYNHNGMRIPCKVEVP